MLYPQGGTAFVLFGGGTRGEWRRNELWTARLPEYEPSQGDRRTSKGHAKAETKRNVAPRRRGLRRKRVQKRVPGRRLLQQTSVPLGAARNVLHAPLNRAQALAAMPASRKVALDTGARDAGEFTVQVGHECFAG